jgi:hypothetical protein
MECPKCGKSLTIAGNVYRNLESYGVGRSALTASECCGAGFIVKMNVSYTTTPYEGDKTEDDWGHKITKNKE